MSEKNFVSDQEDTNSPQLGDMFWAKVSSHPWTVVAWPSMIYNSPDGGEWMRFGKG